MTGADARDGATRRTGRAPAGEPGPAPRPSGRPPATASRARRRRAARGGPNAADATAPERPAARGARGRTPRAPRTGQAGGDAGPRRSGRRADRPPQAVRRRPRPGRGRSGSGGAAATSAARGTGSGSATSRAAAVHQVLATLGYGDAIGHEVLGIQRVLRAAGYESEIFCEHADPRLEHLTHDYWDLPAASHPDNVLIHHFSIGSRASRIA